ncbi:MAG: hypothetical protein SFU86_14735 [Pirellulaceae bacterium]|nr:hypothetical protein [Pirellulaceae bacterium]
MTTRGFWDFQWSMSDAEQSNHIRELKRQAARLESRWNTLQREGTAEGRDLREEIEVLHYNQARTLLLLHGLTTTLLRKQIVTREELKTVMDEIDLLDGQADGALDPAASPGTKARPTERHSTGSALDDLARTLPDQEDPREYLKNLEEDAGDKT